MIKLTNKDCVVGLKELEDNSVDLIVADPPYFINYDGGKGWDGCWDSEDHYLDWCEEWTDECIRVLKDNSVIVVFGTLKQPAFLKYRLSVNQKLNSLPEIIWSYNWGGRTKKNFAHKHEVMWVWSKGKDFLFNADDVRIPRKVGKNLVTGELFEKGTIPTCVWEKNNHTTSKEYVNWHPTQKPLMVLERLIKAYSNEGGTVLDPFSGSASTLIAAENCGRNSVGFELDEDYYNRSLDRIKNLCQS